MKIKHKAILLLAIFACLSGTLYSIDFARADRDLELDYPTAPSDPSGDPVVTPDTTATTLPEYIKYLFNFLIGIGGILTFAVFVYGGVMWTFSAGNPGIIGVAKSKMINGGMGLALLLCSYLIIYTINPDLTVLRLGMIWESSTGPEYTPTDIDGTVYQEVPIGLLTEDILAKNISCFDKGKNLIDCRTKEIIANKIDDIFDRNSHYNYCYEYGPNGDKLGLNDDHDRMDCIKELTKAVETKSAELREKSEELETIVNAKCKCRNCNGPGECDCKKDECFCCGSPREEAPPSCSGNPPTPTLRNDPCTLAGREKIDNLRNDIYQIIYGTEQKIKGKDIVDNPDHDTKNLSLIEARERFTRLKGELEMELNDLQVAEELIKFPSNIKKLNLAQYLEKKLLKKLAKNEFKNFSPLEYDSVSTYCKEFNCSDDDAYSEYEIAMNDSGANNNICDKYELNDEGVLCDLFNLDGDPATFYYATDDPVVPIDRCSGRMEDLLDEGFKFNIVRGGTGTQTGNWQGSFNCNDVCADLGQICVGIGLYDVEKTYCRYIVHNIGMDCQLSVNLEWGECDHEFYYGSGFCTENIPPDTYSWGSYDTGCYCQDK